MRVCLRVGVGLGVCVCACVCSPTPTPMVLGSDATRSGPSKIAISDEEWSSIPREAPKSLPGHYFIAAEARLRDQFLKVGLHWLSLWMDVRGECFRGSLGIHLRCRVLQEAYIKDLSADLLACYQSECLVSHSSPTTDSYW